MPRKNGFLYAFLAGKDVVADSLGKLFFVAYQKQCALILFEFGKQHVLGAHVQVVSGLVQN